MNLFRNPSMLLAGLLALTVFTGCDSASNSDEPVVGEFVGKATGVDDLVAVLADPPGTNGQRKVQIYLCDGVSRGEWFTGTTADNTVDLTSVTGSANVQATLAPDHVSGSITLLDGTRITFDIPPARDGGGLYDPVIVDAQGRFSSTSLSGATLEGQISAEGRRSGTIVLPDGTRFDFERQTDFVQPAGEYTLVALPAGQELRGFNKGVKTETGWTIPFPDL
jgi:hypothetical protein